MKTVNTLQEATAHFENSMEPIRCEKNDAPPQECTTLSEARDYYGYVVEEEVVHKSETPVNGQVIENEQPAVVLPPADETGNEEQTVDPDVKAAADEVAASDLADARENEGGDGRAPAVD